METPRRAFMAGLGAATAGVCLHGRAAVTNHYDLIVAGIGSGGFGAALAGARLGLSVLALEIAEGIGGNAVRSGVTMWEPGVGGTGFPFEIYKRLKGIESAIGVYSFGRHIWWVGWEGFPGGEHVVDPARVYADTLRRHREGGKPVDSAFRKEHWHGVVFEPAPYAAVLGAMLAETGRVTLLTETTFERVETENGRITGLFLTNGRRVTATAYVDGTGGGALCKAAGCATMYGQEGREAFDEPSAADKPNDRVNGVTLVFRITRAGTAGVEPLSEGVPATCWWDRFPAMSAVEYPNGDFNCNMLPTMEGRDAAKMGHPKAYAECERRVQSFWHHVQTGWPEFQQYRIGWIAPALGVRETSRVVGEYVLTEHDLRAGLSKQTHPDIVTIADHSIDRHGAGGGGGDVDEPYGVPYRCLVPKGFSNLLVACRGASFSSLAASSCRLSRTIMQLGQAAGTAAAFAVAKGIALPDVPPDALRTSLREQRCQLEFPLLPDLEAYIDAE